MGKDKKYTMSKMAPGQAWRPCGGVCESKTPMCHRAVVEQGHIISASGVHISASQVHCDYSGEDARVEPEVGSQPGPASSTT